MGQLRLLAVAAVLLWSGQAVAQSSQTQKDQRLAEDFIAGLPAACTGYTTTSGDVVKIYYSCAGQPTQTITIRNGVVIDIQPRQ